MFSVTSRVKLTQVLQACMQVLENLYARKEDSLLNISEAPSPRGGLTCQTAKKPIFDATFFSFFLPRFEDGTPGYAFKMFWKPKPSE